MVCRPEAAPVPQRSHHMPSTACLFLLPNKKTKEHDTLKHWANAQFVGSSPIWGLQEFGMPEKISSKGVGGKDGQRKGLKLELKLAGMEKTVEDGLGSVTLCNCGSPGDLKFEDLLETMDKEGP